MKINLSKLKHMQGIQICPLCGGKTEYAGISSGHIFPAIHTGQMYVCSECGYQGSFIIEVDSLDDVRKMKEALHEYSENVEKSTFSFPEKWIRFWKVILYISIAGLLINIIGILIQISFYSG
ncbi:MAG: hypothetical protein C3F06_01105 [Candidatus Methanoperedenaceae archaeon]|nr:MAG: hypothetical protein C3F06_01105 [Candidatus Methanoperedenaceae archaeon]